MKLDYAQKQQSLVKPSKSWDRIFMNRKSWNARWNECGIVVLSETISWSTTNTQHTILCVVDWIFSILREYLNTEPCDRKKWTFQMMWILFQNHIVDELVSLFNQISWHPFRISKKILQWHWTESMTLADCGLDFFLAQRSIGKFSTYSTWWMEKVILKINRRLFGGVHRSILILDWISFFNI